MRSDPESTSNDSEGLRAIFMNAVATLAEGGLTFPAPFDLGSARALAANIDTSALALKLFAATASRDCGYRVRIDAVTGDDTDAMSREIVNTTVASTALLFALLDGLMDELEARQAAGLTAD